jgi:hypothetical protein
MTNDHLNYRSEGLDRVQIITNENTYNTDPAKISILQID